MQYTQRQMDTCYSHSPMQQQSFTQVHIYYRIHRSFNSIEYGKKNSTTEARCEAIINISTCNLYNITLRWLIIRNYFKYKIISHYIYCIKEIVELKYLGTMMLLVILHECTYLPYTQHIDEHCRSSRYDRSRIIMFGCVVITQSVSMRCVHTCENLLRIDFRLRGGKGGL